MEDRIKGILSAAVLTLLLWPGLRAAAAPGTGRLPWNDYQELLRWQVMAPGVQPPTREYIILTTEPLIAEVEQEIADLGLELVASLESLVVVRGPLTAFEGLGPDGVALPWAQVVLPSIPLAIANQPTTYRLTVPQLREHLGLDRLSLTGRGITVAVLDSGFTGELARELGPARVQMLKVAWENGKPKVVEGYEHDKHGEACARGVLAVAPGVNLKLLSSAKPEDRQAFLEFLASGTLKADVVTNSTFYPLFLDFCDGYGLYAQLGDRVVSQGVFFSFAIGNAARGIDTDRSFYAGQFLDSDRDGSHDFTPTAATASDRNTLEIRVAPWKGTEPVILLIALTWDGWPWQIKPTGDWTCDDHVQIQDIDLFLAFKDGTRVVEVGKSLFNQLGPCYPEFRARYPTVAQVPPIEWIVVKLDRPGTYLVTVRNVTVTDHSIPNRSLRPVNMKLYISVSGTSLSLEHNTQEGCLLDMASARRVISVGAAGWTGSSWALMSYSDRGPTADGRMKPELVAPTGYETPVYLPDHSSFWGTSASAPLVAGVAALLLEGNRTLTPERLADLLMRGARPLCGGFNPPCQSGSSPCGHSWSHAVGCGLLDGLASYQLLRP